MYLLLQYINLFFYLLNDLSFKPLHDLNNYILILYLTFIKHGLRQLLIEFAWNNQFVGITQHVQE